MHLEPAIPHDRQLPTHSVEPGVSKISLLKLMVIETGPAAQ